ncbi:Integrator complex subunit [Thalictrum thalictroides]|uniref:Integrator complex subunit n=1 Tax=Thalictrum thalictroides TaxID=46969 RepID=A0A7J6X3W7_THATH|nr:Integrator complex subunit [Thalictrum thalictroides]
MEKNSPAYAMEWSIELEKGLRSNKPGKPIEAISQIGPRLEQWSKEPISTMVIFNVFGLVPGEDRLFANTILLRLADAFKCGDKHTRVCILKAFLLERRKRKKGKQYNGILAKQRVPNYEELLKRVKIVYDKGDSDSKAISLRLFGCWSDIASDSAEIRHMILSSLGSSSDTEVKASLFTAGCFSEMPEDFAYVFLEVLINMVTSSKLSTTVKLACAKAFAKLGYSLTLATRAYKTGRKLVLNSSQEEFVVEMLTSLSKLASKSVLLISEQVELLLSLIIHNSVVPVQAMAIHCMLFLLGGGVCRFPIKENFLSQLFHVLNNTNLSIVSHCEALRLLLKIFQYARPNLSHREMPEFVIWLTIVKTASQSPILSKRLLAFQLLVDISLKDKEAVETEPSGNGSTDLLSQSLLLVLDRIEQLAKSEFKSCETASEMLQECHSLLSLVLHLVEEYPTLGVLALDKVRSCVEFVVNAGKRGITQKSYYLTNDIVGFEGEKLRPVVSQFVFCMYKFVECCIETLDEASAVTAEVHHILKPIIEFMQKSYFSNRDMCTIQSILLHSRVMWSYLAYNNWEICNADNIGISHEDYWIEHEGLTCEFINKMIAGQDRWDAYKAGKCAACQGAWFAAAFIFRELCNNVQSDACQHWLKSLALFTQSESTIMLPFLPKEGQKLVNRSKIHKIWATGSGVLSKSTEDYPCCAVLWDYHKSYNKAYDEVCSAMDILAAAVTTDHTFVFQRWFLNLRAKVLQIVVDILKLLNSSASNAENTGNVGWVEGCTNIKFSGPTLDAHSLTPISFRLKRLAQELDLMATSFMDMDLRSYRTCSRLALNCSLLAFCTGFVLYSPDLRSHGNTIYWGIEDSRRCSQSMLIQDLVKRLWHVDGEMSTILTQVLTIVEDPNSRFPVPPKMPLYKNGSSEKETLDVCKIALSGFLSMLEEAKGIKDGGGRYKQSRTRLQHLSNVLQRWMDMSFQVPKYFFQIRSCVGAELFLFDANTGNPNRLSVLPGCHLSLNLCLQLKHVPPGRVARIHCILASKPSYRTSEHGDESKGKMLPGFQSCDTSDVIDLNEKLWMYVIERAKRSCRKIRKASGGDVLVWSCASFVLNERGQGFSTCLLDVSAFPVGFYKIKWHSCCIDSKDSYWSLLPLNMGPVFSVNNSFAGR